MNKSECKTHVVVPAPQVAIVAAVGVVNAAVAAVAVVELHQVGRTGAVAAADVERVGQLAAGNERLAQRRLGGAVRLQDAEDAALGRVVVHQVVPAHEGGVVTRNVVLAVDVLRQEDTARK